MKVWKLLIFVLNIVLLGLLITILIKKRKSEKFNGLELAGANTDPWVISLTKQVQENTDAIAGLSPKSIKILEEEVKTLSTNQGKFYSVDKKDGKTTLKADILDAPTAIVNVLDIYPWQIHSSGAWGKGVKPSDANATLNFCVKDPANLKSKTVYNPIFFKFDHPNLGQVWAKTIQSPGFIDTSGGESSKTKWLKFGCPGV